MLEKGRPTLFRLAMLQRKVKIEVLKCTYYRTKVKVRQRLIERRNERNIESDIAIRYWGSSQPASEQQEWIKHFQGDTPSGEDDRVGKQNERIILYFQNDEAMINNIQTRSQCYLGLALWGESQPCTAVTTSASRSEITLQNQSAKVSNRWVNSKRIPGQEVPDHGIKQG